MTRVVVTGCTGFLGREVCSVLGESGFVVRGVVRAGRQVPAPCAESATIGGVDGNTDWHGVLEEADFVIHLAARAHVVKESTRSRQEYMTVNADGTKALAEAAAAVGVRKFIYVSSVKVNGSATDVRAFRADDEVRPDGSYAVSKCLGEGHVIKACSRSGMQPLIVRPPLVYGPGVRANFLRLMRWIDSGLPLPFGAVDNRRSLVGIWNLCDFLLHLLSAGETAQGTWMVADEESVSTAELTRRIGTAMSKRVLLPSIPVGLLKVAAAMAGRREELERLCSSLVVDIDQTRMRLGWSPPVTLTEGLNRTVEWYRSTVGSPGHGI